MKKVLSFVPTLLCAGLMLVTLTATAGPSDATRRGDFHFQLETDGVPLPTVNYKGSTYVEGTQGMTYDIRVFNNTGQRVEAVVTVDGRDVISGQLGDYQNNRGYVIAPYGEVLITGFRTSMAQVAQFYFTDMADAYATQMGSGINVGVIGVAVFKERPRRPVIKRRRPQPTYSQSLGSGAQAPTRSKRAPASSASEAAPCDLADDMDGSGIGTGYGNQQYAPVEETIFKRRHNSPDARLAIYYDDHQGLVKRGVLHQPRPRHRHPDPFPINRDPRFAPPPPALRPL